ncbi:MAG: molybdopterin-dependent oxidoreductase [Caldilineaceae bacterium]|nr:molybdopterin-dependent oxidoreductase [Caldilineaceae bacterium]
MLQPGVAIPPPATAPILTITGTIGTFNDPAGIVMDRATLEESGVVEYTVLDPFEERKIQYRGVLMRDLLALWQVPDDAQTVHFVAINDYMIDVPITDFYQYPVLFALQADGEYMQPDYRGPAMLVYPVDNYEFDLLAVRRKWIWQIKTIRIE